jgi:hypothetical protein
MNNNKDLYMHIENHVRNKFSFLYNLKYDVTVVNYEDYNEYSKLNDFYIEFENKQIHRYFKIHYTRENGKGEITDIFNFRITKNDGHSLIYIDNYMLFIQNQKIKYLWLKSFEGTFEEKLDQLLDYVINILQTYLMPVLKGEKWIDVPTNWYGAK